jgi:hypothetical protein
MNTNAMANRDSITKDGAERYPLPGTSSLSISDSRPANLRADPPLGRCLSKSLSRKKVGRKLLVSARVDWTTPTSDVRNIWIRKVVLSQILGRAANDVATKFESEQKSRGFTQGVNTGV